MESASEVVDEDMKKYAHYMAQRKDVKDLKGKIIQEPMVRMEFAESSEILKRSIYARLGRKGP